MVITLIIIIEIFYKFEAIFIKIKHKLNCYNL